MKLVMQRALLERIELVIEKFENFQVLSISLDNRLATEIASEARAEFQGVLNDLLRLFEIARTTTTAPPD